MLNSEISRPMPVHCAQEPKKRQKSSFHSHHDGAVGCVSTCFEELIAHTSNWTISVSLARNPTERGWLKTKTLRRVCDPIRNIHWASEMSTINSTEFHSLADPKFLFIALAGRPAVVACTWDRSRWRSGHWLWHGRFWWT